MKLSFFILILFLFSCNSYDKKTNDIDDSEKKPKTQYSTALTASIKRGKTIYNNMCIACHMENGKGVLKVFPPLANSDYLRENQVRSLKGIKNGMSGEMKVNNITYNGNMTSLSLTNNEVADVMNYINKSWGNNYGKTITPEEVSNIIKK